MRRIVDFTPVLLVLLLLVSNIGTQKLAELANADFRLGVVQSSVGSAVAPLICVLANSSIYGDVKFYVDRYVSDVKSLGYNATVMLFSGGSYVDVKATLANAYSNGLIGCLLVGDIPWAYYEMSNPDTWGDEVFPIDLFYMDLDGIWTDSDGDGIFDQHSGDRGPEIWVGRIKASGMAESEVYLIRNYFDKNHAYRTGALSLPDGALVYVDDDYQYKSSELYAYVSLVLNNVAVVSDKVTTQPADYLSRLGTGWSLVHVVVHGGSDWHRFKIDDKWDGYVRSSDIQSADPRAFFFILCSCSNARYDEDDYLGGWYVLGRTYGLAAVGTTKIGGMWFARDFYSGLRNETLGSSFRDWLENRVAAEDVWPQIWYDRKWYYGMTILGDPSLSLRTVASGAILSVGSLPSGVTFTVDGVSRTTPWSGRYAENASATVMMPEIYSDQEAKYYWSQWDDGVTNQSRMVFLSGDVFLKGIFELANSDVAVTNVTVSETVVRRGDFVTINITVKNEGDFAESFNVAIFANTTVIQIEAMTLMAGNFSVFYVTWNTSGFVEGNYSINAYAWSVLGEKDLADNVCVGGWVTVLIVGDITGLNGLPDGKCDMRDVSVCANAFGSYPGQPRWNPVADVNRDGKADIEDIGMVAREFGRTV